MLGTILCPPWLREEPHNGRLKHFSMPRNQAKAASGGSRGRRKATIVRRAPRARYAPASSPTSYRVDAPVAVGRVDHVIGPSVARSTANSIRVRHREAFLVSEIAAGLTDYSLHLSVNPGDPTYFPWLSKIASAYDRYAFKSLSFDFQPRLATSVNGHWVMAIDYDPADPDPLNDTVAMQSKDATGGNIWAPGRLTVSECERYGKFGLLVRQTSPVGDVHLYDLLKLHFYVHGPASSDFMIWVNYDVVFTMPDNEVDNTSIFEVATTGAASVVDGASPIKSQLFMAGAGTDWTLNGGVYRIISQKVFNAITNCTLTTRTLGAAGNVIYDYLLRPTAAGPVTVRAPLDAAGYAATIIDVASTMLQVS